MSAEGLYRVAPTVAGRATGPALVLDEPLSLWGGLDHATGRIIDAHHPQRGVRVSGCVLFLPSSRGSSSASSVLAEAIRLGTAPAAFVLNEPDEIIALGCLVGEELYHVVTPVVVADQAVSATATDGMSVIVDGPSLRLG